MPAWSHDLLISAEDKRRNKKAKVQADHIYWICFCVFFFFFCRCLSGKTSDPRKSSRKTVYEKRQQRGKRKLDLIKRTFWRELSDPLTVVADSLARHRVPVEGQRLLQSHQAHQQREHNAHGCCCVSSHCRHCRWAMQRWMSRSAAGADELAGSWPPAEKERERARERKRETHTKIKKWIQINTFFHRKPHFKATLLAKLH